MARQLSKIKKKIDENHSTEKRPEKGQDWRPKESRDMLLIILTAVTAVIMALGYDQMTSNQQAVYGCMLASLVTLYTSRHGNFSERTTKSLKYSAFGFIVMSLGLMVLGFIHS